MSGRRIAAGAMGAVVVIGAAAVAFGGRALLTRQAAMARERIGKPLGEQAIDADRVWGRAREGEPLELVIVGDSIAAGLGATRRKETLGARLAKGLSKRAGRPVRLRSVAVVGAESSMLGAQLDGLPTDYRPDVAVIVVGGNDVTHRVSIADAARDLERAARSLRSRGAEVIVGTCPDLGALRPVPQPLRALGSRMSAHLAAAQADAAVRAGAHAVSLRRAVGPVFISRPDEMFSLDRFHPSAAGYRRTAEALLPTIAACLRLPAASR